MARMRFFSRSSKFFHDLTLINEVLMEPTGRTFAVCCIKDLALHKFRLHSPVRTSEKCMNKDSFQAFFWILAHRSRMASFTLRWNSFWSIHHEKVLINEQPKAHNEQS